MDETKVEMVEENNAEVSALEAEEEAKAKKAKVAAFWDKVTTGLLIFLMASPFLILIYIFTWFMTTS